MQNFGQINETFKEILANAIVEGNDGQKKIFKSYVKELKENKTLRTQFEVFNKLENKVVDVNESLDKTKLFVDECISILQGLNKNHVNKSNQQLVNYLNSKGFDLVEGYENEKLHLHIHNLGFTKKSTNNIESIIESKLFVNQFSKPLTESKETVETYINHFVGPVMIEKFNNKYVNKLSDSEKKLFKVIIEGTEDDKEKLFKSTILECIDLINKTLNEECTINEKDKLLQVKDKLLRYTYTPENFISEITKITNLKDNLI